MTENKFPLDFVNNLYGELGQDEGIKLLEALCGEPCVSVRHNPRKCSLSFKEVTNGVGWCNEGRYLDVRPCFTFDPILHGGGYYVQEASSMIVGRIAEHYKPHRVLDLCAAPGGKSTHLSSILDSDGVLVCNEVIRNRAAILQENVVKWGLGNTVVTSSDAVKFGVLAGLFDMVVVDAPCSGEGMFRKDIGAREQWSNDNVELCAGRGRRIVSDVWNALSTGGIMIYSTCTFNRSENENTVQWICEQLGAEVEIVNWADLGADGVVDNGFGGHFYPHRIVGEGLFCAVLRKVSQCDYGMSVRGGRPLVKVSKRESGELNEWVGIPMEYRIGGESVYGYQAGVLEVVEELLGSVNVLYSGVEMGSLIRGELKPAHALAMYFDVMSYGVSDLDEEEALNYLRKGVLDVEKYEQGLSLVRYNGIGLGWAKRISSRVNNNYPQNWRILK